MAASRAIGRRRAGQTRVWPRDRVTFDAGCDRMPPAVDSATQICHRWGSDHAAGFATGACPCAAFR